MLHLAFSVNANRVLVEINAKQVSHTCKLIFALKLIEKITFQKLFAQAIHVKMAARALIMTRCIYASVQADIMVIIVK